MTLIERIARVLAGQHYSRNAEGAAPPGAAVADIVDRQWRNYRDDALAVLKTMREPDPTAAAFGDPAIWERMVRAVIEEAEADSTVL